MRDHEGVVLGRCSFLPGAVGKGKGDSAACEHVFGLVPM